MNTGMKIKALRKMLGVKQVDMAKMLGKEQGNYSKIESGYDPSDMDSIKVVAYSILRPMLEKKIEFTKMQLK